MPVQIGQKAHGFSEPIGLLNDCHRRIEHFLGVLLAVAGAARGERLDEEQAAAFGRALQYFRDGAPKHTADEEESLFPRLREEGGEQMEVVLGEIERLEAEHVRLDRIHREVDDLASAWLRNQTLPRHAAERLVSLLETLQAVYKTHIEAEETRIFPVASRVLSDDAQQAIGREMEARRRIALVAAG